MRHSHLRVPWLLCKGARHCVRVTYLQPAGWQLINAKRRKNAEGDAPGAAALSGAEVAALVARCKAGWERPTKKKSHSRGGTGTALVACVREWS